MKLTVRWWDGYIEVFKNVVEWRAGAYLLWLKYNNYETGNTIACYRHIPLSQVRWFEPSPDEMPRE